MLELETVDGGADYVELVATGTSVKGEYHCAECGYGVTVHSALPVCPMCTGRSWAQSGWSPLGRAAAAAAR